MKINLLHFRLLLIVVTMTWVVSEGDVETPFEVGTWANFCKGAVSHTFDDNTSNQLKKAVPLFNEKGLHMTIFTSQSFNPDWTGLKNAFEKGHEIGSHSIQHNENAIDYAASQKAIQDKISGEQCVSYAYPYCKYPDGAMDVYVAARGCEGFPNPTTPNFGNIKSQITGTTQYSGVNDIQGMNNLVDVAIEKNGWSVYLHHGVEGDYQFAATPLNLLKENLDYIDKNRDKVWCETFGNVARYIKERDAASVKKKGSDDKSITIKVTDDLDDKIYNYPLSIRLPVEDNWEKPSVKQADKEIEDSIVKVGGKDYLMFQAVPDGGDVVITFGVTTDVKNSVGFNGKAAPITRIRSLLVINRQQFSKNVSVTLFNLAGKTIACYKLKNNESIVDLNDITFSGSAFIAKVTDGVTTSSLLLHR
ncbi:MAG TPA: polysaccharide deacetylase family protein [Chitinispirillaceae bacterium]|nr:polysaccharide deacetylase family protein [Chitinispirillaceae bacterium]